MKENYTKFCYQIIHKMFFLLFLFLLLCPNVRADLKEDKEDKLEKISISIRSISSEYFPPNKYSNFIEIPFEFVLSIWARLLLFCGCSLPSIYLNLLPDKIVINDGRLSKTRDHSHIKETIRSSLTSLHLRNDWHAREYNLFMIFIIFNLKAYTPISAQLPGVPSSTCL